MKRYFKYIYLHYNFIFMGKQPFSLKLPQELLEEVREQAAKEHRPVNNLIEVALIDYLQKTKEKPESK